MNDLNNTFTIKISLMKDGKIDVWSKGMPDTRSFGGKAISQVPMSHRLGLATLGHCLELIKANGLECTQTEDVKLNYEYADGTKDESPHEKG